jgi:rubrerythrin
MNTMTTWIPEYRAWRHGGWYVDNVRYPSGAVGCVSRNFPDKQWRIICDKREGDHTYRTRDEAAHAERAIALALYVCDECQTPYERNDNFCPSCGHALHRRSLANSQIARDTYQEIEREKIEQAA